MKGKERERLNVAIDKLAGVVENGHLLASLGGADLLESAADEIVRLRALLAELLDGLKTCEDAEDGILWVIELLEARP